MHFLTFTPDVENNNNGMSLQGNGGYDDDCYHDLSMMVRKRMKMINMKM